MISPFLGFVFFDLFFDGIGLICVLFVLLLVLDGWRQTRELKRESQLKKRMDNPGGQSLLLNRMADGGPVFFQKHLAVVALGSLALAALLARHIGSKPLAPPKTDVPFGNLDLNEVPPDQAIVEFLNPNSSIFLSRLLTLPTDLDTIDDNSSADSMESGLASPARMSLNLDTNISPNVGLDDNGSRLPKIDDLSPQ